MPLYLSKNSKKRTFSLGLLIVVLIVSFVECPFSSLVPLPFFVTGYCPFSSLVPFWVLSFFVTTPMVEKDQGNTTSINNKKEKVKKEKESLIELFFDEG